VVEWELVVEWWEAMLVAGAVVRAVVGAVVGAVVEAVVEAVIGAVVVCCAGFEGPVLVEGDTVPPEV